MQVEDRDFAVLLQERQELRRFLLDPGAVAIAQDKNAHDLWPMFRR